MSTRKQKGRGLLFANGGACGPCMLGQTGGANCRIGVLNPRYGGKRQKGSGCGCGEKKPMMELPLGVSPSTELLRGGGCGCSGQPVSFPWKNLTGGYRPTKKNLKYLKKWKRGELIGFTMRSSLKAKGLIPRSNGTYKVSPKYQSKKNRRN